jgi:hypothetical protein
MPGYGRDRDPSVRPSVPSSNPDGPAPFDPDDPADMRCPSCHRGIPGGSVFCDQCFEPVTPGLFVANSFDGGTDLTASSGEPIDYPVDEDDVVACPSCGGLNRREAIGCRGCGRPLPSSAYAAALNNATSPAHPKAGASSSGRYPGCPTYRDYLMRVGAAQLQIRDDHGLIDHKQGVTQSERADFLERTGRAPRPRGFTLTDRLAEADDAVELTERDANRAWSVYTDARAAWLETHQAEGRDDIDPDTAASLTMLTRRSLSPHDRSLLTRY